MQITIYNCEARPYRVAGLTLVPGPRGNELDVARWDAIVQAHREYADYVARGTFRADQHVPVRLPHPDSRDPGVPPERSAASVKAEIAGRPPIRSPYDYSGGGDVLLFLRARAIQEGLLEAGQPIPEDELTPYMWERLMGSGLAARRAWKRFQRDYPTMAIATEAKTVDVEPPTIVDDQLVEAVEADVAAAETATAAAVESIDVTASVEAAPEPTAAVESIDVTASVEAAPEPTAEAAPEPTAEAAPEPTAEAEKPKKPRGRRKR